MVHDGYGFSYIGHKSKILIFYSCMRTGNQCCPQENVPFLVLPDLRFFCTFIVTWAQSCPGRNVLICGETFHVCTNDGNDRLRTGIAYAGHILNRLRSLLFFRLHKVVNFIVQVFDMLIQFIQMGKKLFHHPALERRHHAFRSSMICSFGALRLWAMTFCSYISLYFASSKDSPVRRYSRILRALLPLISDTVPDNLILAPSSIFWRRSTPWYAHPQAFAIAD